MGQDTLSEYINRIKSAAGLIASGTGPLHIASLTGCASVGLFPPRKNINQQRWGGIGRNSCNLQKSQICNLKCLNTDCFCMSSLQPEDVMQQLTHQIQHASV
jgi:ADP-heptose:LPS heptosyltransferase